MRIIFDVEAPQNVSIGTNTYITYPGLTGYNGLSVDLMFCESPAENHPELPREMFGEEAPIYIEGNILYIEKMLSDALTTLRSLKQMQMKRMGALRRMKCPRCKAGDPGVHTWECQAKWDKRARKVIAETPGIVEDQR